jgi:hypothetical protein
MVFAQTINNTDYSMFKFLTGLFTIKPSNCVISACKSCTATAFVIKCLMNITLCINIKKAFLYGAIEQRNMTLITFIVEQLHIDIFIPTYQNSKHVLGPAFVKNDDLELLQWFVGHDYNIHEGQRSLLDNAYSHNAKRIIKYVLAQQVETEAANLYMEKISAQALQNNDAEFLQHHSKINIRVNLTTMIYALKDHRELIYIRVLFERYIELQIKAHERYGFTARTTEGNRILFESWNIKRFHTESQYGGTWEYLASRMYKYGSIDARAKLARLGYSPSV